MTALPHPIDRIALFVPSLAGGGGERVMLALAAGFAKRGLQVDLVLAKRVGALLRQVPPGIRVVNLRARKTVLSLPALLRYLRRRRPPALLSTMEANIPALLAKKIYGERLRTVVRCETSPIAARSRGTLREKLLTAAFTRLLPAADAIVGVSSAAVDELKRLAPAAAPRLHRIYNPFVDLDSNAVRRGQAPTGHPWLDDTGRPTVLCVGRLEKVKDHATLLKAFERTSRSCDARLIVLGEGSRRAALEKLASDLGIADRVDFPGFARNPLRFMSRSNLVVLSSIYEGMPLVLIEALVSGCRIVSTDVGNAREILADGKYGALVPIGDWKTMSIEILRALNNKDKPEIPESILNRYSLSSAIESHLQLLLTHDGAIGGGKAHNEHPGVTPPLARHAFGGRWRSAGTHSDNAVAPNAATTVGEAPWPSTRAVTRT